MKREFIICVFLLVFINMLTAQELILANKEVISTIRVGSGPAEVSYASNEEGFYSPEGPMVDNDGQLLFYPSTTRDKLIVFYKGKWDIRELYGFLKKTTGNQIQFISQQGYIAVGKKLVIPNPGNGSFFIAPDKEQRIESSREYKSYPMPFGGIMESTRPSYLYSTEKTADMSQVVRNLSETRAWLPTQPGGFTIGDDGLLYRNGILWSARWPIGLEKKDMRYIGRLMSGHCVWTSGPPEYATEFTIADAYGTIQLVVKIPVKTPYNYGLGPWGEFYYLHAPPMDKRYDPMGPYVPDKELPAELAVYRTHLKYFGRLNDGGVRLRKEPNTTSDILGTYPAKTGFRILEKGTREEIIGGQKNAWYKVRLLDGKEGWFFGAFVANLYDGPDGSPPPWPNVADW